jgi:hypothetical protein
MEENNMQDNYKTIESKLRNREPFNGNSLRAYWAGSDYRVISYSTMIAAYLADESKTYINDTKYSVTTSRHQNLVRKAWGVK